ncbi:Histone deacetylase complex subunit SAP18 [Cytospora mali]|uniref:Histone deacetylase complex subunit SAP18 n=1 Tax=Cytospora mali TaxID=578113 RepID=A0A194VE74_CYTMA|nr:Histone deacetylase complex subunit SAP18 [Valsa mali var. pyri (nom. inval.)]
MDPEGKVDRDATTPFLVKVFYRTGAFHRPDEFSDPYSLPPHASIHTWPSATLSELAHQLAAVKPQLLPLPTIGTRLAFRLMFYDTRAVSSGSGSASQSLAPGRFVVKELGSVVIGDGGPGISAVPDDGGDTEGGRISMNSTTGSEAESTKTLADARFVVGDYISCAILPPSKEDGSVQPASAARVGRGFGAGQAKSMVDPGPPPMSNRQNGFGTASMRRPPPAYGVGGGRSVPPVGEWRRGERLPEGHSGKGRERRRW